MPRLHWFWRVAIAITAGCCYGGLSVTAFASVHKEVLRAITKHVLTTQPYSEVIGVPVAFFLPAILVAFLVFGALTRHAGPQRPGANETRCRKCGYILRGITEPRCPECGERI
jgi:hypothetical protein